MPDTSTDPNTWESIMTDAKIAGTSFPLSRRSLQGGVDGGRIRPIGRAGGSVERTGRKPLLFALEIPLFNGVEGRSDLYPTVYEELLDIFTQDAADASVEYIDPILGSFQVHVADFEANEDADHRDGVMLSVKLEEETTTDATYIVPARTPAREAVAAAAALDSSLTEANVTDADTTSAINSSGYPKKTGEVWATAGIFSSIVSDFMFGLEAGILTTDELRYRVNEINARTRAVAMLDPLRATEGWSAYASCLRMVDATARLAERAAATAAPIRSYEIKGARSAQDVALALYGDAGRVDEVMRRAPSPTPWAFRPGISLRLPSR